MKNDISTPFKYDRPGRTWVKAFMKRNKLSLKKASMICISRKSNTANLFVIYDFHDKLATIFDANPDLNPENIWNCDESGFPTDPGKSKVIAPRNKPAFKLSYGARWENIITLAVCNATGKVLDPVIIFQGKTFQSSWRGDMALPNNFYGVAINGRMETDVFADWFDAFADENKGRPKLLLFDGHRTHISIRVIQRALSDNIYLLKFPPHVTDILQPLDKCCFGPLKRKWEDKFNAKINEFGLTKKVDKAEFINLISSIWHIGMKKSNVITGFETTGIWPLNKEKYDKSRFDIRLFEKYQEWADSGKPELDWASYTNTTQEPSTVHFKNPAESNISLDKSPIIKNQSSSRESSTSHQSEDLTHFDVLKVLGPYPFDCPPGFKWAPAGWKLEPIQNQSNENRMDTSQPNSVRNTSFEELFLDKIKPLKKSPQKKRRYINLSAAVISDRKRVKKEKVEIYETKREQNALEK